MTPSLQERLDGPGEEARRRLKARASAELLQAAELVPVVAAAISPGARVLAQEPAGDVFRCACAPEQPALHRGDLVWLEEWGWAREATRRLSFAECELCGTLYWSWIPPR